MYKDVQRMSCVSRLPACFDGGAVGAHAGHEEAACHLEFHINIVCPKTGSLLQDLKALSFSSRVPASEDSRNRVRGVLTWEAS